MQCINVLINIVCIIIALVTIIYFFIYAQPFERGMFCNDETINYPFKNESISNKFILCSCVFVPLIMFTLIEIRNARMKNRCAIKYQILMVLQIYLIYFFGLSLSWLSVEVTKIFTGRLRPHFLDVCNPIELKLCQPGSTLYINNITCQNSDAKMLRNARLSFPSGHTTVSFYLALFLDMFLEHRQVFKYFPFVRHLIQICLILLANLVALSRISEHMHHWSDCLAGFFIGITFSILVFKFIFIKFARKIDISRMHIPLEIRKSKSNEQIKMESQQSIENSSV